MVATLLCLVDTSSLLGDVVVPPFPPDISDIQDVYTTMYQRYMIADFIYTICACLVTWNYHKAQNECGEEARGTKSEVETKLEEKLLLSDGQRGGL